ncbi:MAG: endo-1,4-beta-xylanase [bacterium]
MHTDTLRSLAAKRGLLIGTAFCSGAFKHHPEYGDLIAREFNCLVAENDMKLDVLQPVRGQFDFSRPDVMMSFARKHDMKVRAVPLVWHIALPAWAEGKTFSRNEALDILREHIFTVMQYYRGQVIAWDVVNEALSDKEPGLRKEGPWYNSIGTDYVEQAYHMAHEADPQAVLFYNDYNMDCMNDKAGRCYMWIKELLARGVPIHGIGLQCHFQLEWPPAKAALSDNIKRFNDLGLIVHMTELDVWLAKDASADHLLQQAEVYCDIFQAALSAKDCPAILLWGLADCHSWIPGQTGGKYDHALIFDRQYRPKPAYAAIAALLRGDR